MGSLDQDIQEAVKMWKDWEKTVHDPRIVQDDIASYPFATLWVQALQQMDDRAVPNPVVQAAVVVHPKEKTHVVDSAQMWKWYEFWLNVFEDPHSNELQNPDLYEILQQYTCKGISDWMNLKYGICILAATRQGAFIAEPKINLVERLAWTKGIALSEEGFQFRQIFMHAADNNRLRKYRYPKLIQTVKTATTMPFILKAHISHTPTPPTPPPKPSGGKTPGKKTPPKPPKPDSGGGSGMGIMLLVLLLLAAAVTFSKK